MPSKPKNWISDHRCPGLQVRDYNNRYTYRLRQRYQGKLYIDYLGEMPLAIVFKYAHLLRINRSDPVNLAQIYTEIEMYRVASVDSFLSKHKKPEEGKR
ncbi:hypothetical protein [Desulfovibrio litoralis]|uniref:Uncharacterized protein n=1 Tax=Desulfovibrio litoralis DSM 11393 TaxID=1121455 RepID=A0A1M7TNT7_9BACT|nr:hypothetical protein [Desulfovibrio litoralis]SHN72328.1 hypothetical protein SAMN02745728_02301 [Desulfovibrio litoralis DSM 11393]